MARGYFRPPTPHGTWARYQRHLREGETPCQACKAGARAYRRANYAAVRERQAQARAEQGRQEAVANVAVNRARRTEAWAAHVAGTLTLGGTR